MSDRIDELVDTPEQALRFLDTVMHSDNEDMRRGAFNRVSIHIQQAATIARDAIAEVSAKSTVGHEVADAWQTEADNWKARALKAEAMCERLVKFAADCDECPRTRYDEDEDGCRECLDSIRRSAREAVSK